MTPSLRDRRNLTSESNACEAAPGSSFWAPNGLNELPQRAFRISFHLDCRIDNGIFNRQTWRLLKSWYTGGDPEQGIWRCFTDGLNKSLVSSAA